jgi:hypothetical protein
LHTKNQLPRWPGSAVKVPGGGVGGCFLPIISMEEKVLPRFSEWSVKERLEKKLPTHNQNTTNYVEYSIRMTKDTQFSRVKAYNLTDLLSICLDDSKLYTRRYIDVSNNHNYHLFTNQKSNYLHKKNKIDPNEIIQMSESEYLDPSENIKDKLYTVDMKNGLCQYPHRPLKGPCKHKGIVSHKYKMKNFEILPEENTKMRAIYNYLSTGIELNEDLTDVDSRSYGWIVEDMEIGTSDDNDENGDDGGEDQQTVVWYFCSVNLGCIPKHYQKLCVMI